MVTPFDATGPARAAAPSRARRVVVLVGLGCLALIAGAWFFELVIGLRPCKLCLEQRLPHYLAIVVAAAAAPFATVRHHLLHVALLALLAGLMLWSAGLGAYHAGVEWGWFLGPNDCGGRAAPAAGNVMEMMKQLQTVKVVSCTEAAWRFLGLSLAGWNALASLVLAGIALTGLWRAWRGEF